MVRKTLMIYIVICLILSGCSSRTTKNSTIEIPKTNKIELTKIWEIESNSYLNDYVIDENKNYMLFKDNTLEIIDKDTGKHLKNIKLSIPKGKGFADTISVYDDICAINFSNLFIVIDTKSGEEVYKHVESENPFVLIGNAIMYKNLVIWEQVKEDIIYGVDYNSGKIIWKISDDEHDSTIHLHEYKGNFIYYNSATPNQLFQFDPNTGETIKEIEMEKGRRINDPKVGKYILPYFNEDVGEVNFRKWLMDSSSWVFSTSSDGYTYHTYKNTFYYYGLDGAKPIWQLDFPDEIYSSNNYGKYALLDCETKALIFDMEKKEVVWSLNGDTAMIPKIDDGKLYVATKDGRFIAYDITGL